MSNIEPTRVMGTTGPVQDRTLVVPGGSQATMVMPAQADALRTQMGGTTTCPVCKSTTPLMDPFCGDCGFLLSSTPAEDITPPSAEPAPAELVDPVTGRRFRLHNGVNTLGRQGTDILVADATVSRNHAQITVDSETGAVTILDLGSSNGTKVGDQRLAPQQPVQAASGAALRFGNWNVTLEMGGAPSSAAAATISMPSVGDLPDTSLNSSASADEDTFIASSLVSRPAEDKPAADVSPASAAVPIGTLRRIEGPGEDIAVSTGTLSIGRRPENSVVLAGDAYISGRHAEIISDATGTYIVDVGSTNGTVLNGEKLKPNDRVLLSEGDEIHIGQSKFRFEAASPESTSVPDAGVGAAAKSVEHGSESPVEPGEA